MKAPPIRSQLLFFFFIFADEVVFGWGSLLLSFNLSLYCIALTWDKSGVSWDDNTAVVYSKEHHWQGRLFRHPNWPQVWMKMSVCDVCRGCKGQTEKRVDLRARQSCFVVTELLSQFRKMPTELHSHEGMYPSREPPLLQLKPCTLEWSMRFQI